MSIQCNWKPFTVLSRRVAEVAKPSKLLILLPGRSQVRASASIQVFFEWQWVTECPPTWLFRWHTPIKANQSLLLWWHQLITPVSSEVWHEGKLAKKVQKSGHFWIFGGEKMAHFWEKFNCSQTTGTFPPASRPLNNSISRYHLDLKGCTYD